jgi:hypothetical protein
MGVSNFSSDDVLVGAANLLYAPVGTTKPSDSTVAANDFASWPTGWVHLGYTDTGPNFTYGYDVFEVTAQQSTAPLKRRKTSETLTIAANLLQFEATHIALATHGTITHTAAGVGQKEVDKIVGGGDPTLPEYMFAWESTRPDVAGTLQPVRMFLPRGTITQNGETSFQRDGATVLPVQVAALLDASLPIGQQLYDLRIVTGPTA